MKPPHDRETALQDIDHVLGFQTSPGDGPSATTAFVTRGFSCIERNAPAASIYRLQATKAVGHLKVDTFRLETIIIGLLTGLRADVEQGKLARFEELVHADLFSDFLDQAEYLLSEGPGYRRASAVLGGGTLEEHLRQLAARYSIEVVAGKGEKKKASQINADLYKAGAYDKADQDQVASWQKVRNDAAHGDPDFEQNYSFERVGLMLTGIRQFVSRHPA